jgi:hypothetical protein
VILVGSARCALIHRFSCIRQKTCDISLLIRSIAAGTPHRADGALALHVLEGPLATQEAVRGGQAVTVASRVTPAALLPAGWTTDEETP